MLDRADHYRRVLVEEAQARARSGLALRGLGEEPVEREVAVAEGAQVEQIIGLRLNQAVIGERIGYKVTTTTCPATSTPWNDLWMRSSMESGSSSSKPAT